MGSFVLLGALVAAVVVGVWGRVVEPTNDVVGEHNLDDTELVKAFAVFRHGDRTADQEELELYSNNLNYNDVFFPYGMKALTNKGKQRAYSVGEYLRNRYDGLISKLYLPEDIAVRTTPYVRTQMSALAALAALYPPMPEQKWNPTLDWQPIPYNTVESSVDDLIYWSTCPRHGWLKNQIYESNPEMMTLIKPHEELFSYMSEHSGNNITIPEHIFTLDNLFQTLGNVEITPPQWAIDVMPQIKEMTKIKYTLLYKIKLIVVSTGVLLNEVLEVSEAAVSGNTEQPKLWLYSAHENNVAALMSAAGVFEAHQPSYGSTFSLELRRHRTTGEYGFTAVYARNAGGPEEILPIPECENPIFCNYATFVDLTKDSVLSREDYQTQCRIME
ncbi:hypothetical protein ACJJTC_006775 [Scirpophaga incertulas]